MTKPLRHTTIALALLVASAGSAQANPLVAAVAAAPLSIVLAAEAANAQAHTETASASTPSLASAVQTVPAITGRHRENSQNLPTPMTVLGNNAPEGSRLQLNANLFATSVHGYQSNACNHASRTWYSTNAGDVRTRGIESEAIGPPLRTRDVSL